MALSKPKDNDAMRELTSAKTVKEDVALLMAPYINFEHFLVPAPLSICVLGRLMLVATQADFDLSKKPPKGGFQLLRHPESFRACLVQVANDGYRAFNKAHTNMDKIRLQSMQTPDSLKSTLQVLFKGSPDEIQDFLPIELNTMKNSAEDCLKYAKETEAAFDQIMLVTAELLEACVSAEGQYNQQLRETEIKLKVAEMQKQKLEIEEELNRENKKKLEEAMDKAEEEYYKALNDIPGAWGLIGIQATENISNTVSGALNCLTLGVGTKLLAGERAAVKGLSMFTQNLKGFSNLAGKVTGIFKKGDTKEGQAEGQGQGQDEEFTHVMDQALMTSCTRAIKVQSLAQYLYNTFVKKDDVTLNLIHVTMETKRQLQQCVEELKAARTEVEQFNNDIAGKVHALCGWWIEICSDLQGVLESITVDEQTGKDIAERMTDCHSRAVTTASQAESIMGNAHFDIKPPILVKQQTSAGDNEERSMKDLATENAKMKLTMSSETFKQSQEMYDKACDRLKETNQELRQFMAETAELDMKKVDFEKIRETLKRGIVAFAELRDQWSKMVQFFQMTTNIIDVCLNKTVKKLTEQVEVAGERSLAGYSIDGLRKDMIYQQAFQAAKISHVVNMVSTSYVQVSQGHVMSRIAGLSRLLSFNPETDHDQIQRAMFSLTHDFEEAQDEIVDLVQKNKRDFDQRVDLKLKALSRALPPSSPGTERLQAAVKQGVAQAKVTLASRPAEALSDDAIDDLVG